ncbi:MAG: sigma-70 family RNA polymerase sigma factor [Runella slithyformis]|jgi:RNA polymerase sigma factor (sigma-70 family)|nr:MAG: sigma-70 family RNA polymerase sigma factor [Runella sp.]TAG19738.1 MAG: sigma-70 family RNA polymerase sigma factor [Cytophagales bacterium]TAG38890.1 MAG: sigma-70 family RNA polymerase sigma factor [Cytophagia bacterium]TAG50900.1 MAG: sigma-70 family RNA polymerase sigma factor [Runella slithyformis]TAG69134.1 MAG: sigma-70 family RNA polymerase sigma factor [Runella slithyformis]
MIDERTLIERCQNKDRIAQRMFYEHFAGKMLVVCQRYSRSNFEAEDVLQDAFVKIFTQIHTFRFDCPLDAWVRRVVVNTAISNFRKEKIAHAQTDIDHQTESISIPANAQTDVQYEQLLKAVQSLPIGSQTVFNLYAIEGYQHQEIAQMLGISEGTSKSQYARAKQLLQQKLKIQNLEH